MQKLKVPILFLTLQKGLHSLSVEWKYVQNVGIAPPAQRTHRNLVACKISQLSGLRIVKARNISGNDFFVWFHVEFGILHPTRDKSSFEPNEKWKI